MIQSGALDEFGERGTLIAHLETLLSYHREHTKAPSAQVSLFAAASAPAPLSLPPAPPASQTQRLAWEKELLGLFVSGHPLDAHRTTLAKQKPLSELAHSFPRGMTTVIGGFLESTSIILTKKGDKMLFGQLADATGSIEIVAFPKTFEEYGKLLEPDTCLLLKGTWSTRNGEPSFAVDRVKPLA